MKGAWYCESKLHEGSRLVSDVYDQYERRVQFRRRMDYSNRTELHLYNVCRDCVKKEYQLEVSFSAHPAGVGKQEALL